MIALFLGFAIGPHGLSWINPEGWPISRSFLIELAAQLTIGIALTGAGLRLPPRFFANNKRNMLMILGPVMLLMWLSTALIIHSCMSWPIWIVLLMAAALTPTDPVLASTIVEGCLAEEALPERVRHTISAESGINDGFAYPLVILPILMIEGAGHSLFTDWFLKHFVWNIGGGIILGWSGGWLLGKAFLLAGKHNYMDQNVLFGATVALALVLISLEELIGVNGILAIFVAGRGFNACAQPDTAERETLIQDATNQFFDLPIFTMFGVLAPYDDWVELGWRGLAIAGAIILLRRLPWMLLLRPWIPAIENRSDAFLIGWFGPMGAAALFYASFGAQRTGNHNIWVLGSLVVTSSIIVHGMSTTPISKLFARHSQEEIPHAAKQ
jgi:NhaP-type Na+/H+ or K+/H+ antiporter